MTDESTIEKRRLGRTSLSVTPIGLGLWQFSGGKGFNGLIFPALAPETMNAIVKAALDGGINWFDTAEVYGNGHSERALATALRAAGVPAAQVIVVDKWWPLFRTAGNIPKSIDTRLHMLDQPVIDLYLVHQPWSFSSVEAEMEAMAGLVEAGKVRAVGVSNFDAARMERAFRALEKRGLPLAVNQVQYSLLQRQVESNGVLQKARELGVTLIAYSPLAAGLLSDRYLRQPERLKEVPLGRRARMRRKVAASRELVAALAEIGEQYGATASQVALNWLIHFHGELVVAIPGATRAEQAAANAGSMRFRLSPAEMARLDELSRPFR